MLNVFFCFWLKKGNSIFERNTRTDESEDDTRFHWCIFSRLYGLILYGNAYRRNISYYVYTCKNPERSVISVISIDMNYAFILLLTCHILSSAVFIPFRNGRAIAPFSMDFNGFQMQIQLSCHCIFKHTLSHSSPPMQKTDFYFEQ